MLTDKIEVADKSCSNNSERILQRDLVESFLKKYFFIYGTDRYTILDNGIINVDGDIVLINKILNNDQIKHLPIQFGYIKGNFNFDHSNIESLKGFPHTVECSFSIKHSKNIKTIEHSPRCKKFKCFNTKELYSLDGLNCEIFKGHRLNLKQFGTNFFAKEFRFDNFPTPTADEMRHFIQLNPIFKTNQNDPWIKLIKSYQQYKDYLRLAQEFEVLYNEPLIKPEQTIDIINTDLTMSM